MKTGVRSQKFGNTRRFFVLLLPSFSGGKYKASRKPSEEGVSLIEALVGIMIITLVLSASAPPILLAAATRIQNQRAEQAMQIAQRELDRVRLLIEQGDYKNTCSSAHPVKCLPPVASVSIDAIQDAVAPTTSCLSTSSSCLADNVTQAIEDGDFLIQTFRDPGISEADAGNTNSSASNAQIIAFRMGVRVYSKFAKENLGSLETEAVALGMTQSIGQQNKRPLAILYTDFVRGDVTLSLQGYRKFLQP